MRIRHSGGAGETIKLQMTPMIDIVFLLLIFFIMTFKIVEQEGDFNIKMPRASQQSGEFDDTLIPPMNLYLTADATGRIDTITLNETLLQDFNQLNDQIISLVGRDSPAEARESAEIKLVCDYRLKYEETVRAVTAVTGYKDPETGEIVKLIENVKFEPQPDDAGN